MLGEVERHRQLNQEIEEVSAHIDRDNIAEGKPRASHRGEQDNSPATEQQLQARGEKGVRFSQDEQHNIENTRTMEPGSHAAVLAPASTSQPEPINKYSQCLSIANHYLHLMRLGYYGCLLRFIFVALVYYFIDFMIPNATPRPTQSEGQDAPAPGQASQAGKQPIMYQPWNVMIYFLSNCIDMINLIGYVSSMSFLRKEIKVLQSRHAQEQIRVRSAENMHQQPRNPHNDNVRYATRLEQMMAEQENASNRIRIGKESTYMSMYSTLLMYKYKNKDQSAAFKIAKLMHLIVTFLFFGRYALIEQYSALNSIYNKQEVDIFHSPRVKQFILWLFLLSTYTFNFQADFHTLEASSGPYIRCQHFPTSKILQVYTLFLEWRQEISLRLKVSLLVCNCYLIVQIVYAIAVQSSVLSVLFGASVSVGVTGWLAMHDNRGLVQRAELEQGRWRGEAGYVSMREGRQGQQEGNSNSIAHPPVPSPSLHHTRHPVQHHPNLSLLGLCHRLATAGQHSLSARINTLRRISIFVFGCALMRQSQLTFSNYYVYLLGVAAFAMCLGTEYYKFESMLGKDRRIEYLTACKYSQIAATHSRPQPNTNVNAHATATANDANGEHNNHSYSEAYEANCCTVCLASYAPQEEVYVLACGHVFHQPCLDDWLKQKKECPLCRLDIQQYYYG